jgi:hypothetical protein
MIAPREQWQEILELGLQGCGYCDHVPKAEIDRVANDTQEIIAAWLWECEWSGEHDMAALVRLSDGYAVVSEGEDTSGHGCQCSGDIGFYRTLDEAYRLGLSQDDRDDYQLATEPS